MKKWLGLAAAVALFFFPVRSQAAGKEALHPERWEFRAGYAYQYKHERARPNNFQLLNFLVSAAVPMDGLKGSGWLKGRFEWAPELWLGLFTHPYVRPLIGVTPIQFRYVFETEGKIHPYLFMGAGILYANINLRETRSDLNFNLQGGMGFYYALNDATSLIFEYRHVHISNAGLHEDNAGMNNNTFLAGVSFKA